MRKSSVSSKRVLRTPIEHLPADQRQTLSPAVATDLDLHAEVAAHVFRCRPDRMRPAERALYDCMATTYTSQTAFLRASHTFVRAYATKAYATKAYATVALGATPTTDGAGERDLHWGAPPPPPFQMGWLNRCAWALQLCACAQLAMPVFALLVPLAQFVAYYLAAKAAGDVHDVPSFLEHVRVNLDLYPGELMFVRLARMSATVADLGEGVTVSVAYAFSLLGQYRKTALLLEQMREWHLVARGHIRLLDAAKSAAHTLIAAAQEAEHSAYRGFADQLAPFVADADAWLSSLRAAAPSPDGWRYADMGALWKERLDCGPHNDHKQTVLQLAKDVCAFDRWVGALAARTDFQPARFSKAAPTLLRHATHPAVAAPVGNTVDFAHHLLLTGPNAAGKTTVLKSALLNHVFAQQWGGGFFAPRSTVRCADVFHSYLAIPHVSARESLFEAEARRCKDILDALDATPPDARHVCVFDELFSGTNPDDAVASASAFVKHLVHKHRDKVRCLVTTHFAGLCHRLRDCPAVCLRKMEVVVHADHLTYLYTMHPGISTVRGGKSVLLSLQYPAPIVDAVSFDHEREHEREEPKNEEAKEEKETNEKETNEKERTQERG